MRGPESGSGMEWRLGSLWVLPWEFESALRSCCALLGKSFGKRLGTPGRIGVLLEKRLLQVRWMLNGQAKMVSAKAPEQAIDLLPETTSYCLLPQPCHPSLRQRLGGLQQSRLVDVVNVDT